MQHAVLNRFYLLCKTNICINFIKKVLNKSISSMPYNMSWIKESFLYNRIICFLLRPDLGSQFLTH